MEKRKSEIRAHAQALLSALEVDDHAGIELELKNLVQVHDHEMFQELGRLTRELHQAIQSLSFDPALRDLAENEIPDAKARLQHVIEMTEQAAHRTMEAVEELIPLQEPIEQQATALLGHWERMYRREMAPQEFAGFAREMKDFLEAVKGAGEATRGRLTDILMAQEYQDLSSQIIRRVIDLVQQVEEQMVGLVQAFAGHGPAGAARVATDRKLEGPQVNPQGRTDVVTSQDEVDDLLSSLGF